MLGPCDGPPPESFVTPLGNSLPTAANGSIAPLAPDPSAALRTIRALNDEEFDVVHLHEPLAPGPTVTTLLMHPAPLVGTFHAAGRSSSYQALARPLRWFANRIDRRVVVSKDALGARPGAPRRRLRGAVQRRRDRPDPGRHHRRRRPIRRSSSAVATRSARVWRCCSGVPVAAVRHSLVDRQRRPRRRQRCGPSTLSDDASRGSAGSATPRSSPASVGRRRSACRRCTANRSASC